MKKINRQRQRKQRVIIFGSNTGAVSKKRLAEALQNALPDYKILRVALDSRTFTPRNTDITINWGSSKAPRFYESPVDWKAHFNNVDAIRLSVNKLNTFEKLQEKEVSIPEWTTDREIAKQWWDNGETVIDRVTLNGFGGEGIVIYQKGTESDNYHMGVGFPIEGKLFVKYKKKKHEYRVHVFNGKVIDITWKRKRKGFIDNGINSKIRNIGNDWVFTREGLVAPHDLEEQAIKAVAALDLDFGAVDIIWNQKENKSYVLEINSAPGIEGTTLEKYTEAFCTEIKK